MKNFLSYTIALLIFNYNGILANSPIPQSNYIVQSFSSDNSNHPVADAFDGDPTTWWAIYNDAGFSLPGVVEVDLGAEYDVSGFAYTPNPANSNNKAIGFEIFLSSDGINWGTPEALGDFPWVNAEDVTQQHIYFGAITARYVKLVYTSSQNTGNGNIHTGDLFFYESDIPATGQSNQTISFDLISTKYSNDQPFELNAVASSGLPLTYSIISGPASVSGNTLTLDGTGGNVAVKVEQSGNNDYYPSEAIQLFEVIDLSVIFPSVSTRLTEDYPIEMPDFHAYPIYIYTEVDHSDALSISNVDLEINGNIYSAIDAGGYYYYWWTPQEFGTYTINITSTATNGNQTTIAKTIAVTNTINSQNVTTMEDVVIEFGGTNSRWFTGTYTMPQHIGSYDQIMANLTIECPNGNCDDWDRKAYIDVIGPDGNWIQIIRYMTPYGVACNHQLDVTDYASLLQGEFEIRMFIDTWGTGGWQVTLDFDHQLGTPEYLYSKVDEIWDGTFDLGNPNNLQPVDTINYVYESNIESSHLRLSTTGHGWGDNNSQNAAEFYHATNFIDIDDNQFYSQDLWNICNPNPDNCTNQAGTWQFSRAGWCPGAIAPPNQIDLTNQIENETIALTYRFDSSYIDNCHPNNPGCISGITCPDCNDNFRAEYLVDGQIINFSNSPIADISTQTEFIDNDLIYDLEVFPNPTKGSFKITTTRFSGSSRVYIQQLSGKTIKYYSFQSVEDLNAFIFNIEEYPSGMYFISIENDNGMGSVKFVLD